jgi:diguanylate cyclase (GGDEF)-like protein
MTISLLVDDGETAAIRHVHGIYTTGLLDTKFSLQEKSLASILYSKNLSLSRNFAEDRYEIRYGENEPRVEDFASFLAVPLGVDDCKGMILLESLRPDAFPDALCTLLSRIATSAGLAMEKVMLIEKNHALATHDGLTGLFNHRQFQQLLRDEIIRSGRYNDPLALVIGDLDLFKKTNDTYGHPFGDMVLKNVASILDTSIRAGIDTAARYGGEEFALILVKTDEQQAMETVERIRAVIERSIVRSPAGEDMHVTMSFGIALLGKHARDPDDLIKKADKALYRAKGHGRNRVEIF